MGQTPQFNDAINRAHAGKNRIKMLLIADLDPAEWGTESDAVGDIKAVRKAV
jgi:hypothetical protein